MRSGSSTTCGCRISWSGTYYWGIPRGCWLPCGISQYCNPRTSCILPTMAQAGRSTEPKLWPRSWASPERPATSFWTRTSPYGPTTRQSSIPSGEARAIPRPASAVPLSDAPLAWQPTLGRCGGSRVCRIPRIGRAGRSWKPFTELGPRFSCLLMLLRSVSLKCQEGC